MGWFRHSRRDAIPVSMGLLSPAVAAAMAVTFGRVPLHVTLLLGGLQLAVYTMHFYGYHYHSHTPFLRSSGANRALDVVYSVGMGMPFSFYTYFHLRHHTDEWLRGQRYDSFLQHTRPMNYLWAVDFVGVRWALAMVRAFAYRRAATAAAHAGMGGDGRYSWYVRKGEDPSKIDIPVRGLIQYPALFEEYLKIGALRGQLRQMTAEVLAIVLFWSTLLVINRASWMVLLPMSVLLTVWRNWSDYVDHYGTDISDPERNSVSCYAGWFNAVTFNNGYHLEHHRYPGIHWTKLTPYRSRLVLPSERFVVRGAQWLSPFARKAVAPPPAPASLESEAPASSRSGPAARAPVPPSAP